MVTRIETTINRQGQTIRYRGMTPKKLQCKKLTQITHSTADLVDYATHEPGYPMPMIPPIGQPAMMVYQEDGTYPLSSWITRHLNVVDDDGQVIGTQTHEIPVPTVDNLDVCRMERDYQLITEPQIEGLERIVPISGRIAQSSLDLFAEYSRIKDNCLSLISSNLVVIKSTDIGVFSDLIYPLELRLLKDGIDHRFLAWILAANLTGPAHGLGYTFIKTTMKDGELWAGFDDSVAKQMEKYFEWYYSRANLRSLSRARWAWIRWRKYVTRRHQETNREIDRQICLMRTLTIHELKLRNDDKMRGITK